MVQGEHTYSLWAAAGLQIRPPVFSPLVHGCSRTRLSVELLTVALRCSPGRTQGC